jgi:DNA-binding CsgD family transcriptional regulator
MKKIFPKETTYKYPDKFHLICAPIFEKYPITFCSIGRLYNNNTYSAFMSNASFVEVYIKKHYSTALPLWLSYEKNNVKNGHSIWTLSSMLQKKYSTSDFFDDCNHFNYHHGISLIDKNLQYVEIVRFIGPKINGIAQFFFENRDLLRNIALYLKEKIFSDKSLSQAFNTRCIIPSLTTLQDESITNLSKQEFFNVNHYYFGYIFEDNYLTKREVECLKLFFMGKTAKQIAKNLSISFRTVEKHIENIRIKAKLSDSSELKSRLFECKSFLDLIV